jgi:hypothetical protein
MIGKEVSRMFREDESSRALKEEEGSMLCEPASGCQVQRQLRQVSVGSHELLTDVTLRCERNHENLPGNPGQH